MTKNGNLYTLSCHTILCSLLLDIICYHMLFAGSEPLTFYNPTSSARFGESLSSETLVVVKPTTL